MNFLYLGLTLGPIVSGEVYVSEGQKVSWYVCAATICACGVFLGFTATMIQGVMKDPLLVRLHLVFVLYFLSLKFVGETGTFASQNYAQNKRNAKRKVHAIATQ